MLCEVEERKKEIERERKNHTEPELDYSTLPRKEKQRLEALKRQANILQKEVSKSQSQLKKHRAKFIEDVQKSKGTHQELKKTLQNQLDSAQEEMQENILQFEVNMRSEIEEIERSRMEVRELQEHHEQVLEGLILRERKNEEERQMIERDEKKLNQKQTELDLQTKQVRKHREQLRIQLNQAQEHRQEL